ncbi:hypothetical protein MAPG_01636 [Magnaporthiopsis poae ATCC 64411]|uniref:Helicase ATP-binding domain-containing protein n=1 Tax=Magnaporthiopsis poae (strain ATCC 64411 / 73-15) TaxID=644358 RepID=A0A0C4DP81_MAGP6|nr:hypothetical protein MAPG_01636 [Magnaporthiopsis poae ATCC 64411]
MEGPSEGDGTQRHGNINPELDKATSERGNNDPEPDGANLEPGNTGPEPADTNPEPALSPSRPPSSGPPTDPTAEPQHDIGLNSPPKSSPVVSPKQGSNSTMELALVPLVPGSHSAQPVSDDLGAPMPEANSTENQVDESVFVEDYMDENESEDEDEESMFVDNRNDEEDDEPMFVDDSVEVASQRAENAQAEETDPDELMEIMEEDVPQEARKRMQEEDAKRKQKEQEEGLWEQGDRGVKREREDNEEDESDSDDVQIIQENELSPEALRRIKKPRLSHLKTEGQDVNPEATAVDDNEVIHVKTVAREQPILLTAGGIKGENGNGQETPVKIEDGTSLVDSKGKARGDGTFAPIDGVEQALPANWDGSNNKSLMERYLRMSRKLRELVDKEKETGALEVEEHEALTKLKKTTKEAESKLNRTLPNGQENPGDDEDEGSDSDDGDNPEDPTYVDAPAGPAPTHKKPPRGGNGGKAAPRRPKAARSAEEWWSRQYKKSEENGRKETDVIPDLFHTGSRANGKGTKKDKRATEPTDAKGRQLLDMLRDQDPVMARAALGDIPMPGAVGTNKKPELLRVIKDEAARNARPKTVLEEQKILRKASESFGAGRCKAEAGLWKLQWMSTPLYHHQLVGVHWMLGREFSPTGPHGGILADQMGLGKTVEMLAAIVHNPGKPTLIVVPAAAIPQWQEEIRRHVEAMPEWREESNRTVRKQLRVFHYKSKGPNNDIDNWKDADIVLASYQEVAKAYPSEEALRRISGMGLEGDEWRQELDRQLGQLYQVEFHRIVLDEAHAIKNINSRTSKACIHLPGKYRWALSGTPIHNCIEELLPYFKFLGADWALKDMEKFSQKYGGGANEGTSLKDNLNARLAAVVPTLVIRRRVDDKFVGQDLLRIPKTNKPIIIKVDLSVEERIIYKRVEQRFRDNISSHMSNDNNNDGQGQARQKKMRTYFAYLTRLRQLVGHPFQIETTMRIDFTLEDIKHVRRELAQLGGQTPLHMQIRRWMDTEEDRKRRAQDQGNQFGTSGFGGLT